MSNTPFVPGKNLFNNAEREASDEKHVADAIVMPDSPITVKPMPKPDVVQWNGLAPESTE